MIILFEKLHDTQNLWSPCKHYYLLIYVHVSIKCDDVLEEGVKLDYVLYEHVSNWICDLFDDELVIVMCEGCIH